MNPLEEYGDCVPSPLQQNDDHINYERALREMQEKEKELCKRTEMLENMIRSLASNLPTRQPTEVPTSTPIASASPPQFLFSTPPRIQQTTSNEGSSFLGHPKLYLREALEAVPKYDGHNIPVWQFARACKRAKESVPFADEALLVRMLRNKLTHHAYLAVEDEIHSTVDKFIDCLKRTFGPGRSSNYYRGQLSIAYKKPNEHILDYIGRIKDLKTAIIEGDQTNLNRSLTESESSSIEAFALEAFYEGLPREYRIELRAEGYDSFVDACSKVIIINRRLEREETRYKGARTSREPTSHPNQTRILQNSSSNARSNSTDVMGRKICTYCNNIGHVFNECRKRQYSRQNNSYPNNNNNFPNRDNFQNNQGNRLPNNNHSDRRNGYPHSYNNSNNNNNNNNTHANQRQLDGHDPTSGNHLMVSATRANRDQKPAQHTYLMESNPIPSTSSEETTNQYPLSS